METTTDLANIWARLRSFTFDHVSDELTFTKRLARENGWSEKYARDVVDEYRRFLFLSVAAGHTVTPSDAVDQAWHLHLTYTDSYWNELCPHVLGRPLHHGPTRGGVHEKHAFVNLYDKTLESYETLFGYAPPSEIWPPSEVRFAETSLYRRVDTGHFWLVPKPSRAVLGVALVFILLGLVASLVTSNVMPLIAMIGGAFVLGEASALKRTDVYRDKKAAGTWAPGVGCGGCAGCGGCGGCGG